MTDVQAVGFVHHANQLVIGNGYRDRDGLDRIVAGYRQVLSLHRRWEVPLALHLSGTLIEALAWHAPKMLHEVRTARDEGWLRLVGGCYAEAILTLQSPEAARRQIAVMASVLERHLGIAGGAVEGMWLPERVWAPALVDLLTDQCLPGGGFKHVFVDDRLLAGSPEDRASLDRRGPWGWPSDLAPGEVRGSADPVTLVPRSVSSSSSALTLVPICSQLRYLVPANTSSRLAALVEFVADVSQRCGAGASLLIYGDDLERTAGVGGWEPAPGGYEAVLRWVAESTDVHAFHVEDWLERHPPVNGPTPAAGSYYELAVRWGAGEDYRGWATDPHWQPHAVALDQVQQDLGRARVSRSDPRLVAVAERIALIGSYETAWHDPVGDDGGRALAGWVQASAAHVQLARPLLAAARWSSMPSCSPAATMCSFDQGDSAQLVIGNESMWCLVSPLRGARICLMAHRGGLDGAGPGIDPPGAALIVGNPADDWNLQQDLFRYMDEPAGHPGALTDRTAPHTPWTAAVPRQRPGAVTVDLVSTAGASRRYALVDGIPALVACIRTQGSADVSSLVAPDYLGVLNDGSKAVTATGETCWAGIRWQERQAWVAFNPGCGALEEAEPVFGWHGRLITLRSRTDHLDVLIGAGPVNETKVMQWLSEADETLHR